MLGTMFTHGNSYSSLTSIRRWTHFDHIGWWLSIVSIIHWWRWFILKPYGWTFVLHTIFIVSVHPQTETLTTVKFTLINIGVRFIIANNGWTMITFKTFGMEFDLTTDDHHWSRHDIMTMAATFTILVIIVLAAIPLTILFKIPAGQLFATYVAPVDRTTRSVSK